MNQGPNKIGGHDSFAVRQQLCLIGVPISQRKIKPTMHAYDEIIDFIAAGTTPDSVAHFEPSQRAKDCVADLIHKEKTTGLTPEESSELEHFMNLEHIMRLAKARARSFCPQ